MEPPDDFLLLVRAENGVEANLIAGILESEGIPCLLQSGAFVTGRGFSHSQPETLPLDAAVDVLVPPALVSRAREIVFQYQQDVAEPEEAEDSVPLAWARPRLESNLFPLVLCVGMVAALLWLLFS